LVEEEEEVVVVVQQKSRQRENVRDETVFQMHFY
jgi:hypothetical protein